MLFIKNRNDLYKKNIDNIDQVISSDVIGVKFKKLS